MTMRTDDPDVTSTALIGLLGAVIVLAIVVALEAYFAGAQRRELEQKNAGHTPQELVTVRSEQLERLHTYRWVDRERGIVAIPIERAMELVARESGDAAPGSGR